jgi:radical SAM protein with 4Fe4S-binding SPASM domain
MWHKYKIMSQKDKIEKIQAGELPIPSYATLHLSYSCNQRCINCAYASYNIEEFIPVKKTAFKYVNELMNFGVKAFDISGGGDPTMIPYILDLLKYIIKKGGNYSFVSNGWAMRKDLMDFVAKTATYIRISLETGDKELYCSYKNVLPFVFDKVVEHIKYISSVKHPDTEFGVKYDVDKILYGEKHIDASLAILEELGVDYATFKSMAGKSALNNSEKEWISNYLNIQANYNIIMKTKVINSIINKYPVPQCKLTPLQVTVDGKGKVYICCYYYEDVENRCIGDLNTQSFEEIWNSERHLDCIKNIDPKECSKFDCHYFTHHETIKELFKRGRLDII